MHSHYMLLGIDLLDKLTDHKKKLHLLKDCLYLKLLFDSLYLQMLHVKDILFDLELMFYSAQLLVYNKCFL